MRIGRIERVALREVWAHEAHDFTTWLKDNLDVLNGATGLSLGSALHEQAAGSFSVDLVAVDSDTKETVVVENQFGKSDHDHLGKLVTYASMHAAASAVWIAEEPRPEHATAVNWLNESMPTRFYLVKAEAVKIGDSMPAPMFTLIVGPNAETKAVGIQKESLAKESSQDDALRLDFWKQLYKRCDGVLPKFANKKPGPGPWSGTSSGGYLYQMWLYVGYAMVQLRIDAGDGSEEQNQAVFDRLFSHRDEIERAFGGTLRWDRMDAHRACCITKRLDGTGFRSPQEEWPALQESMIEAMRRLMSALDPCLK